MADIKTIKKPRITEKVALLAEKNIYTFEVSANATKNEIRKDIEAIYKIKPVKVNIVHIPKKTVIIRGKKGVKNGGKKAMVYLKKGDKIDFA
ncbi:MAG: 50S ribosomal protein L23 [Candidatus Nomurabacteria bacterium]|nr:50S ribosomal protein L23 [Candidatus Nomurabacteria bacterium]